MTLKSQTNAPSFRIAGISYISGLLLVYLIDLIFNYLIITIGGLDAFIAQYVANYVNRYTVLVIFFSFILFGILKYSREYTTVSEPSMIILLISSITNILFLIVLSIMRGLLYYRPSLAILITYGVFSILYAISSIIAFVALWKVVRKRTKKPLIRKMNLSFIIAGISSFIWNLLLGISAFDLSDFSYYSTPIEYLFNSVEGLVVIIISILLILVSKIEDSQSGITESPY